MCSCLLSLALLMMGDRVCCRPSGDRSCIAMAGPVLGSLLRMCGGLSACGVVA